MSKFNEELYISKIQNNIHKVKLDNKPKTLSEIFLQFDITLFGTNSRQSLKKTIERFLLLEIVDGTKKYVIKEVYDYPLPQLDEKFKKSPLYPFCTYFLLHYLVINSNEEEGECIYLKNKEVSDVFGLCNKSYVNITLKDMGDLDFSKECHFIIEKTMTTIYRKTNDILESAKGRHLIFFVKTIFVVRDGFPREATIDEKNEVEATRDKVAKKYGLKSYDQVYFDRNRETIYDEINDTLRYAAYNILKFTFNHDTLYRNRDYIKKLLNTNQNPKKQVNDFFCNSIFDQFINNHNIATYNIKLSKNREKLKAMEFDILKSVVDNVINKLIRI